MSYHSWLNDTKLGNVNAFMLTTDSLVPNPSFDSIERVQDGGYEISAPYPYPLQPQLETMAQPTLEVVWQHRGVNTKHLMLYGPAGKSSRPLPKKKFSKIKPQPSRGSRDQRARPPSLAATHPANYALRTQTPAARLPQPPKVHIKHVTQQPTPSPSPRPSKPPTSLPDPPWRQYTDPMWQTSTDPNYWYNNYTILKCDSSVEVGNVTSPTCMVGLPCGGMVEMAYYYPDEK